MKNRIFILLLNALFVLVASHANSATYYASGQIEDLLVRNSLDAYAIVYIKDFRTAGTCKINGSQDLVILSIKGSKSETMYSTLLSAYMANKEVRISTIDTKVDADGHCILNQVRLNTSF